MIPTIRDPSSSITPVHQHEHVHTHACGIGQAPSVLESVSNPRLNAQEGTPICTWIQSTANKIKTFFVHGFADAYMLVKAFNARGVSDQTVDQRIREVYSWVTFIATLPPDAIADHAMQERFFRLSPDTRSLFYNHEGRITQGGRAMPPTLTLEIQEDMLLECRHVIFFQRLFSGRGPLRADMEK